MKNQELQKKLKNINNKSGFPSLTLLMPVDVNESQPAGMPVKILNDLINEAKQKLKNERDLKEVKQVIEKLGNLQENIQFEEYQKGYAIFLSADTEELIPLQFPVEKKVYIGENFQVRDVVFSMNRLEEYLVLMISGKKILTLRGFGVQLSVIKIIDMIENMDEMGHYDEDKRFTHRDANAVGDAASSFISQGEQEDEAEKLRNYIIRIDGPLGKYLQEEDLRLVVVGTEKNLGYFKKFSRNNERVAATVTGNYDHLRSQEIGKLVWPAVEEHIAEEKEAYLKELDEAVGRHLSVSGLPQIWMAANEGRVKTVIVEKDFQCKARKMDDGYTIDMNIDNIKGTKEDLMEDAVDDLIELVINKGGNVVFVEKGKLETHQKVAAITRY